MAFAPRCSTCGLYGDAGCYRRFAQSHDPHYRYEKRKVGQGVVDWCIEVLPRPRLVAHPDNDFCPDWRDASGHSAAEVRQAMTDGERDGQDGLG